MTSLYSATKPTGSLSLSYTPLDDQISHDAGYHFIGTATDKQGFKVNIWQTQAIIVDAQGMTDILNGLFDFPYATKALDYAAQIVCNSASKGVNNSDAVTYKEERFNAVREHFESVYLGGNRQTARRNEHGDYVLPSIQDAWAGWRCFAGV